MSKIWRAFGLKPDRAETFKLSTDPFFVDKVHDVVGLCLDPPGKALVLWVDEKPQIQAGPVPAGAADMPHVPERQTADYVRHGTTTLFAALTAATGEVVGALHRRHRAQESKKFPTQLDREVPDGLDLHT